MTAAQKAAQTRRERSEKAKQRFKDYLAECERIRATLNSIMDDPDATNAEKLQAAELLKAYHKY